MLYATSADGDVVVVPRSADGLSSQGAPGGRSVVGFTEDDPTQLPASIERLVADPETRRLARRIASRLLIPKPPRSLGDRRGAGDLRSLPYRDGGSADLDLDGTVEKLVDRPFPGAEDIVVRDRARTRRSVVLVMDVSGSMRGERVKTAAATMAAMAGELERDFLAVIAFWSDAALLLELGQPIQPMSLLDALLTMPARGLTNVAFPLRLAAEQLSRVSAQDSRVVLVSDCVHNAGPDPRPLAASLPQLDVLLDVSGEKDVELGRDLARAGHGLLLPIRTHRDVPSAVGRIFAP